jgi:hypothetical protein
MIIFKEKKSDSTIKEISFLYTRLHLLFSDVAQAFVHWSLKQEGIVLESGKSSVDKAKSALIEIDKILAQLKSVDRKFKFDNRELNARYRDELNICEKSIEGMTIELNTIWKHGKPSRRDVPFGDTTNYKFIISHLISYMERANGISGTINAKSEIFNKNNKDLQPLPVLKMITAPSWVKSRN